MAELFSMYRRCSVVVGLGTQHGVRSRYGNDIKGFHLPLKAYRQAEFLVCERVRSTLTSA